MNLKGPWFELAGDVMLVMRPTGEIIDANQAAALTYGYTKDELLAMTVFDLHPQQGHDPVQSVMNRAMTASLLYEALHVQGW